MATTVPPFVGLDYSQRAVRVCVLCNRAIPEANDQTVCCYRLLWLGFDPVATSACAGAQAGSKGERS